MKKPFGKTPAIGLVAGFAAAVVMHLVQRLQLSGNGLELIRKMEHAPPKMLL